MLRRPGPRATTKTSSPLHVTITNANHPGTVSQFTYASDLFSCPDFFWDVVLRLLKVVRVVPPAECSGGLCCHNDTIWRMVMGFHFVTVDLSRKWGFV